MAAISLIELNIGIGALVYVIVNFIVGFIIISKYFQFKQSDLLLVGISWIGVGLPWLSDALKVFWFLYDVQFTDMELIMFFSICTIFFTSVFAFLWLLAITNLLNVPKEKKIIILGIVAVFGLIFEVIFINFIINDVDGIGYAEHHDYTVVWSDLVTIYLVITLLTMLISGLLFAREGLTKSGTPETVLKSKLLLIAFILFAVGAIVDIIPKEILDEDIHLIVAKYILAVCSVFFYMGYTLPDWSKKLFLK